LKGDSICHPVRWKNNPDLSQVIKKDVRFKLYASDATIYSLMSGDEREISRYWEFRIPHLTYEMEKNF
jgi:hypothetical protein